LRPCQPFFRRSWVDGDDAGEAGEVAGVERQDFGQAVSLHSRDEPGVVRDLALAVVGHDQRLPHADDRRAVRPEREEGFEATDFRVAFLHGQTEAVIGNRAGGHNPEFVEVLRDDADGATASQEFGDGRPSSAVGRVVELGKADQDVRVELDAHSPRSW